AQIEAGETGAPSTTGAIDVGAATEATPAGAAAVQPPSVGAGRAGRAGAPGGAGRAGSTVAAGQLAVAGEEQPGGGRGGPSFDWCNNAGPTRGYQVGGVPQPPPPGWTPPALDARRGGLFRSDNKGQSWTLMSNCN